MSAITKPKISRSKEGCLNCKRRKKKCDEIKPICSSCFRRNANCEYKTKAFLISADLTPIDSIICSKERIGETVMNIMTALNPTQYDLKIKLPFLIDLQELNYFEYYCNKILPGLSILPQQELNIYSRIHFPIAFHSKSVFYSLVLWGCRSSKNSNEFQKENQEADIYKMIITDELENESFLSSFTAHMILVCMESSFGDTEQWSNYFTSSFNLLTKNNGLKYLANECSIEGKILAENFAYFDVLASQSNEFGMFFPMSEYAEVFQSVSIHDPLQGCIYPQILLLGEVISLSVEFEAIRSAKFDITDCDKVELVSELLTKSNEFERKIIFTKPDLTVLNKSEYIPKEIEYHLTLFEIFQLANQLYVKQIIKKLPPIVPEVEVLAYNLFEDLKVLIQSTHFRNTLGFPMLVLGLTICDSEDRLEVQKMFQSLIQSCGYHNYYKIWIVIQKIWEENKDGSLYIDWFKVTKKLGWKINLGR